MRYFVQVGEATLAGLSYIQANIEDFPVVCMTRWPLSMVICMTDMELMHMNAITLSAVISVATSV